MPDNRLVESFLIRSPEEKQRIVRRIIQAVQKADPALSVAIKWNQLTFAKDSDFHHWICGIRLLKNSVNLYFHFGALLEDPQGKLSSGESKFVRWIPIRQEDEIENKVIESFTKKAIAKLPFFTAHWKEIQSGVIKKG